MTELKPVEDMTRDEVAAELARVRAERAALNGAAPLPGLDPDLLAKVNGEAAEQEETAAVPAAAEWPHQRLSYAGLDLEVRKPDESALVAVSMTGTPGLPPQVQMRIFTKFLVNHLSPESFTVVVEAMTDPDSGVNIQGLITALTRL